MFSVVDAKEGFLQCPLDETSSYLTTMHTSYGRYRWLRMPFGINSAPEEFQMRIATALEGLEGIASIADDVLIYGEGETDEEADVSHDIRLVQLMERCKERSLKLNPKKFKFKLPQLKFMGHWMTKEGVAIDRERTEAIQGIPEPKDRQAIQRFLGTMNHLSMFCPKLSDVLEPLRALVKDDTDFEWSAMHQEAFLRAKRLVISAPVLRYYDMERPVVLQVDASDYGIGAALLQPSNTEELQPVAYASCIWVMGDAQGWPACPSEDPKDVSPEPEYIPPGDAQGWPACPEEKPKDVPAEPLMIPLGDAAGKIVQRDPLNMRRSDRIKQPPKYLNDYCRK